MFRPTTLSTTLLKRLAVVDDFHAAAVTVARTMTDLVERWPAKTAQLVLASRVDPPLRLHRLSLSGELCELRDRDLYLSLTESQTLLANFGVQVAADDLALLHPRSEGWVAAVQMAALTLRGRSDPARALNVRSYAIAEYFISEVLEQQPAAKHAAPWSSSSCSPAAREPA
jgi:LuxR family transcriptional regulator, maltose regulon positive regulatory protein